MKQHVDAVLSSFHARMHLSAGCTYTELVHEAPPNAVPMHTFFAPPQKRSRCAGIRRPAPFLGPGAAQRTVWSFVHSRGALLNPKANSKEQFHDCPRDSPERLGAKPLGSREMHCVDTTVLEAYSLCYSMEAWSSTEAGLIVILPH
jgi:hypothetical protein